jgi:hypothetical protein
MLEQFIPLYCALVGGAFAAGVGAIYMSHRLIVQAVRSRPAPAKQVQPHA